MKKHHITALTALTSLLKQAPVIVGDPPNESYIWENPEMNRCNQFKKVHHGTTWECSWQGSNFIIKRIHP